MYRALFLLLLLLLLLLPVALPAQEKEILTVLDGGSHSGERWIDWTDGEMMLVHHLNACTRACLAQRETEIAGLRTGEDWQRRQTQVKRILDEILGPWPERTPLNARETGVLEKDGYRVEKIIFESLPNFHVTGALFVPQGHSGRGPAILKVIGHSGQAFRRDTYQNVILNLVHKGFIVFAIDPLGQGERLQYFDPATGKSEVGSSTAEHSHAGVQCFLAGKCIARYFIWDGIRAVDYLLTRPEVDPDRIGVTGLSGGGTQSSYIGAVDERIRAAAPMGYITSLSRLLGSIGPQDAEQVFLRGPLRGIDHADLLEVRAPKPTLHVTTTRDFFSIQGARETEAEVRRAFAALGQPDCYDRVEDDYGHGFTRQNNEATYAFFQRFLELPGDPAEQDYPYLTEQELTVTQTGQISTALGSETVFSINRREAQPLLSRLQDARRNRLVEHLSQAVAAAGRLAGFQQPQQTALPVFRGQYQRDGYRVEKWGLDGEGETVIPVLVFAPDAPGRRPAILYAHGQGKAADAGPGGPIESLVRSGYVVAAPDLLGYGETAYGSAQGHGPVQPFFNALMAGRSVAGINAGDAVRVLKFLQGRSDVQAEQIGAVAIGDAGPALLHAAAFQSEIRWLVLVASLLDYQCLLNSKLYEVNANSLVAGALTAYDLPDLLASLAPRRAAVLRPRGPLPEPLPAAEVSAVLAFAARHAAGNLRLETQDISLDELVAWCAGP
jgi:cephalosporin-C deacetylase-like acetyl esterase